MHRIYQINKLISRSFFYLLAIILIIFSYKTNTVYGANTNWVEISKTPTGIQYLDIDSISKEDKGLIEISTKYLKLDNDTSKGIEENFYIMKINCVTHKFKDISVNGENNFIAKWEEPNGDKLIIDVISDSCKNV